MSHKPTLTTTQRGYGTPHKRERARLKQLVDAGEAACVRCGYWIDPKSKWMLGHDHRFGGYLGPEHYRCGLAERNKRYARVRAIKSREW